MSAFPERDLKGWNGENEIVAPDLGQGTGNHKQRVRMELEFGQ